MLHWLDEFRERVDDLRRFTHGVLGAPPKVMKVKFPKLVPFDAAYIAKNNQDAIVTVLTKGKGNDMKPFKDKLSPAQMASVAQYVKELATRPRS